MLPVIRPTQLPPFPVGTRRASPVAGCVLVAVLSLTTPPGGGSASIGSYPGGTDSRWTHQPFLDAQRSRRISRTPLSCPLHATAYVTSRSGSAFGDGKPRLLHLARPAQPSPWRISLGSGLAANRCFSQGTSASRVAEGVTSSRAPSLRGRYPASSLLRAHPPPSRRRPTSRCCRLYGLPRFRRFRSGRGGLLQLLSVSLSPCCR